MEHKCPNVQFILEALVGSLVVFTSKGYLLLEDQIFEPLKKDKWAVLSPEDSILSKIHQVKADVFSGSILCLGGQSMSKVTAKFDSRRTEHQTSRHAPTPISSIATLNLVSLPGSCW